jgi:hypothetical protein
MILGFVPEVEVPDDRNVYSVRGPDREIRTAYSAPAIGMGPQFFMQAVMPALLEKEYIHISQHGHKTKSFF